MRDIDMAVELLEKEGLSLAIVKDSKVIFTSTSKGIKPYIQLMKNIRLSLKIQVLQIE